MQTQSFTLLSFAFGDLPNNIIQTTFCCCLPAASSLSATIIHTLLLLRHYATKIAEMARKTLDQHFTEFEQSLKDLGRFHYEFVKSQFEELRTVVGDKMTLEELAAEYHQSDNVELKEKLAAKDQEIACLRAENEQLREELSGSSRRPICENCWLSGNQCDLEGPCTSCGDRGLYCERKECGNPRSCAASRCPRVH